MITLPKFELFKRQPDPPGVSRVVARREIPNKHGALIIYEVRKSRRGTEWWLSASLNGMRMSNTLHTGVATKGAAWIAAVESGQITVEPEFSDT